MSRFDRQMPIVGEDGQARISSARVGIVGCGDIGVNALTYLVEAGVSDFVIWDPKVPEIEDLNGQFIYAAGDMRPKCVICAEWVLALNYTAMADAHSEPLDESSFGMFSGCSVVLDCLTGSFDGNLAGWCSANGIPIVRARVTCTKGYLHVLMPGESAIDVDAGTDAVLGCHAGIIAGMQVSEALKIITGTESPSRGRLLTVDLDDWSTM